MKINELFSPRFFHDSRFSIGYDPDLPVLAGDPRLNPGKGIGINWHPSQPIR